VVLLDEPLSNLDAKLREEMRVELKKLIKKVGISALYVTHDQEEAFVISDKVVVMSGGKILQYDSPDEIYNHPTDPFVASFIGHSTLVAGDVIKSAGGECVVRVPEFDNATLICAAPAQGLASGRCSVVIKNGDLRLSHEKFSADAINVLQGTMTSREYRGGLTDHRVRIGSKEVVVTSHRLCPMINVNGEGGTVFLCIEKSAISLIPQGASA
jgi:iron(III) transport system ATP-binding protein